MSSCFSVRNYLCLSACLVNCKVACLSGSDCGSLSAACFVCLSDSLHSILIQLLSVYFLNIMSIPADKTHSGFTCKSIGTWHAVKSGQLHVKLIVSCKY